jgi:hypothetical protein
MKASFQRSFAQINNSAGAVFIQTLRREGDSNPRSRGSGTTVFETAAFDHSAISPILYIKPLRPGRLSRVLGAISPIILTTFTIEFIHRTFSEGGQSLKFLIIVVNGLQI